MKTNGDIMKQEIDRNNPMYIIGMCVGVYVLGFCAGCGWLTAVSLFD